MDAMTEVATTALCRFGDPDRMVYLHRMIAFCAGVPAFLLGVPGNILIILIARKKDNRHLSPSIYMIAMAVADTFVDFIALTFSPFLYGEVVKEMRGLQFIVMYVSMVISASLSGFYLAAMSVDRAVAVRFPMAAPRLCTTSKAKKVVFIGTFIMTAANSNLFYTYQYIKDPITGHENVILNVPGDPVGSEVASAFQMVVGSILPFAVIITCNIIIILTVKGATKTRAAMMKSSSESAEKGATLTRMLILVSCAYLLTSIPYRLFFTVLLIPQVKVMFDLNDSRDFQFYNLIVVSLFMLWTLNFGLNFYMYCLGGGEKYRRDIRELFTGGCICHKRT